VVAGLVSGTAALPAGIVLGLVAFGPLGPEFAPSAITAGIYVSLIAGLVGILLGTPPGLVPGATLTTALALSGVVVSVLAQGPADQVRELAVAAAFATVVIAGLIQLLFRVLRLGQVLKYLSAPLVAGIVNGAVLLLFYAAGTSLLGDHWFSDTAGGGFRPAMTVVALLTAVFWIQGSRIAGRHLGPVLGLGGGLMCFAALTLVGLDTGPLLGARPPSLPAPAALTLAVGAGSGVVSERLLVTVLVGAFVIALMGTMASLLALDSLQEYTRRRQSSNRHLVGLGAANLVAGLLGALPAASAPYRVHQHYDAGGRGRAAALVAALTPAAVLVVLAPWFHLLPEAVVLGLTLAFGWLLADRWSIRILMDAARGRLETRGLLVSGAMVMALVMILVLVFGVVAAVLAGVAATIVLQLLKTARPAVRRVSRADRVHSRKQRYDKVMQLLEREGRRIATIEVEGTLSYAAMDGLLQQVDDLLEDRVEYLVLNLRRVHGLDIGGARGLGQLWLYLRAEGVELVLSHVPERGQLRGLFRDFDIVAPEDRGGDHRIPADRLFEDQDSALQYCEDDLVTRRVDAALVPSSIGLDEFFGLERVAGADREFMDRHVDRLEFREGDLLFRQGEPGDSAYIVARGSVAVTIDLEGERTRRLATFSFGTIVGEMALIDGGPRSANVVALEDIVCYRISTAVYQDMKRHAPQLAFAITEKISRILVSRLRYANQTIAELES
jgi:SulP family sulfate permease